MGPYLTVPKRDKDSVDGDNDKVTKHYHLNDLDTAEVRSHRNARLEEHNGGLAHLWA